MKLEFKKSILVELKKPLEFVLNRKGQSQKGNTCSFLFGLDCITGPKSCNTNCKDC